MAASVFFIGPAGALGGYMMSSSDLPACPACGSRRVHCVQDPPRTFYACMECGRDQTEAWAAVQPALRPKPLPLVGAKKPKTPIAKCAANLGIAATVKS